jgi:transposase-like protein
MKTTNNRQRRFSTAFKKEKVELIDQGKISIKELCAIYEVSQTSVYKWKKKYSKYYTNSERIVVEKISEEKKNIELLKQIAELERVVGKKQIELDYYKTTLDVLSEEAGEDLKKKHKPKL